MLKLLEVLILLLFVHIEYIIINAYMTIEGTINVVSFTHNIISNIAIITKYIFVLETKFIKFFSFLGIQSSPF